MNEPESVPPLESMPPAHGEAEEKAEATAAELSEMLKVIKAGSGDVTKLKIALLRDQVEFLGESPTASDDNALFVKRLVTYCLRQTAVIDAQNEILIRFGIL